ncbi:hypothetical protein [Streptomyces sp. NPDC001678]|uniref:hypothetical protein n=1 Tax=Streptomyces sp. NPDC001678 TaxID=3364599 RepID=UPI003685D123
MLTSDLEPQDQTPEGAALDTAHDAAVAATAQHIRNVIGTLRELDLGTTAPAAAYHPGGVRTNGTV